MNFEAMVEDNFEVDSVLCQNVTRCVDCRANSLQNVGSSKKMLPVLEKHSYMNGQLSADRMICCRELGGVEYLGVWTLSYAPRREVPKQI
jgi:hypothetical protein